MPAEEWGRLNDALRPHEVGARVPSAALLAWFLETVWRVAPEEVVDSICDGKGDKGIDGLRFEEDSRELVVFQSKRMTSPTKTQGDNDLKAFRGIAPYFEDGASVQALLDSNPRPELKKIITRLELPQKLEEGPFSLRLVFVTSGERDASANDYLRTLQDQEPPFELWDQQRLVVIADRTAHPGLLAATVVLNPVGTAILGDLDGDTSMAVARVSAQELVQSLPGIDDLAIFDLNVRLGLGRTRINRDIASTLRNPLEHALFPAYHNGLTMLTNEIDYSDGRLTLQGISVVNGCQSLLALHGHKEDLTEGLTLLVKVVRIVEGSGLETKITHRSNNQNPVNFRDQRSTDTVQIDLQRQVAEAYGDQFFYGIRRGEEIPDGAEILDNQEAAQFLMAVWVGEPWAAVRKLRLFDQDYSRVFSRSVSAHTLRLVKLLRDLVEDSRDQLPAELVSSFAAVRFTLAYALAELVRGSQLGRDLLEHPQRWLPDREEEVAEALRGFVDQVADSASVFIESKEEEALMNDELFDSKTVFKSATGVRALRSQVVQSAKMLAKQVERAGNQYWFDVEPS